jgi:hypothetical protein
VKNGPWFPLGSIGFGACASNYPAGAKVRSKDFETRRYRG